MSYQVCVIQSNLLPDGSLQGSVLDVRCVVSTCASVVCCLVLLNGSWHVELLVWTHHGADV